MKTTIIKTSKLCKSFVTGKTSLNVLKNLDLEIYEGDFTVIMGSSGSGKSTLLYSLSTMDAITGGSVQLLGKEISASTPDELSDIRRNEVSFVFQGINLLPDLTAFENIAYSAYTKKNKAEINRKTEALLEKLGLSEERDKYPGEMSGGQQQRAAIARALIGGSKIMFGDEPTGALNSASGKQVLDILTEINKEGQSIVMVTHDLKAAARATRLLYITDGHIDGDLELGRYHSNEMQERKNIIYKFLEEHNW